MHAAVLVTALQAKFEFLATLSRSQFERLGTARFVFFDVIDFDAQSATLSATTTVAHPAAVSAATSGTSASSTANASVGGSAAASCGDGSAAVAAAAAASTSFAATAATLPSADLIQRVIVLEVLTRDGRDIADLSLRMGQHLLGFLAALPQQELAKHLLPLIFNTIKFNFAMF